MLAQAGPPAPQSSTSVGALKTFQVAKPPGLASPDPGATLAAPPRLPAARESLQTMVGLGYVEGADWGAELLSSGSVAGAQVQLNTLVTRGSEGLLFDHGSLSVFHPESRWHVEAGDLFSHLRGVGFGTRVSWATGKRRPTLGLYGSRRQMPDRPTVVSYRDQIIVGGQTLLDAEVASDRSHLLRSRLTMRRFEIEALYRSHRGRFPGSDASLTGGVRLWRGLSLNGGLFGARGSGEQSEWRMIALRVPVSRFFDLTVERAFAGGPGSAQTTTAATGSLAAGDLRLFHRYQHGDYDFVRGGYAGSLERRQTTSMTSYSPGPRLNLTLQLATQRADTGQVQHWEELQATIKVTPTTVLRTVTAVPDLRNADRFQAYLRQELPGRFALQADYGRLSAYQPVTRDLDRPRMKLMLFKTVDIATPARGVLVAGRVIDSAGRGVAGARVKLGPYSADAGVDGRYVLRHVPRGEYDLSLDPGYLPADFAWDGHRERVSAGASGTVRADLRVTPLNAIHGRVFADINANGQVDPGEAVEGAVLRVGEHLTMTGADGAYALYNVWPGAYVVRMERLPASYEATDTDRPVLLRDGAPATGVDFRVSRRAKRVIWEGER